MRMIDTHAHLFAEDFDDDLDDVIDRALTAGVVKILLPNIDEKSINSLNSTVRRHPDVFLPMMGLHPTSVTEKWKKQLEIIYNELNSNNYIAIGEVGLDLYWDKSSLNIQQAAFEQQLKWSVEKELPVSMHSRNAIKEVIASIKRVDKKNIYGVFHSFGGSEEELENILQLENFYVGVNGVVTFKNSGLDKVIKNCPLERLVIETDSPWLAPIPNRGKRNESSYLTQIIKKLSSIYEIAENDIAERTYINARKVFNIWELDSYLGMSFH